MLAGRGQAIEGQTDPEVLRWPPPKFFHCSGAQGGERVGRGLPWRPHHCPSPKGRPRPLTLGENPLLCAQIHSCCHTAVFSFEMLTHVVAILRSPQLPKKEDLSLSGPTPGVIQSSLSVTPQPSVRHQVGTVLVPLPVLRLVLQSHPSSHDLWQCANVAGIN